MPYVCVVTGGSRGIGRAIVRALLLREQQQQHDEKTPMMFVYNLDVVEPLSSSEGQEDMIIMKDDDDDEHGCGNSSSSIRVGGGGGDDGKSSRSQIPPPPGSRGRAIFWRTDVSDAVAFQDRLGQIWERHDKRLDCLVNNAGIFETPENDNVFWNETTTTTTQDIDRLLRTNLGSVVHGTRTAFHLMKKTKEKQQQQQPHPEQHATSQHDEDCLCTVINIASTAAFEPFPMHPVYGATKCAVLRFTQTAQLDLMDGGSSSSQQEGCGTTTNHSRGFRIYAICPGICDTDMGRMGGKPNQQAVAKLKGGKRTSPDLVASAVVGLVFQCGPPEWMKCSYLIVDNHEITAVSSGNTKDGSNGKKNEKE